jgi:hypothetical protein
MDSDKKNSRTTSMMPLREVESEALVSSGVAASRQIDSVPAAEVSMQGVRDNPPA